MSLVGLLIASGVFDGVSAADNTVRLISERNGRPGDGQSMRASLNYDGTVVAFTSSAENLLDEPAAECGRPSAGMHQPCTNVFVRQITSEPVAVSRAPDGDLANGDSLEPSVAAFAMKVAFASWARNLFPNDTNDMLDVFVADVQAKSLVLATRPGTGGRPEAAECKAFCGPPFLDDGGRRVIFSSWASNLVENDSNGLPDVFMYDATLGTVQLISRSQSGQSGQGASYFLTRGRSMTFDGQLVVFTSTARDLVSAAIPDCPGGLPRPGPQSCPQVYAVALPAGEVTLLSRDANGIGGDGPSFDPIVSGDGRVVIFTTSATTVLGRRTDQNQLMMLDLVDQRTKIITTNAAGQTADAGPESVALSADGSRTVFISSATNLAPVPHAGKNIFLYDRHLGTTKVLDPSFNGLGLNGNVHDVAISGDGELVAVSTTASNVVANVANGRHQVFLFHADEFVGLRYGASRATSDAASAAVAIGLVSILAIMHRRAR